MRPGRGFTLVELLLVVTVMGILSGILVPVFSSFTLSARLDAASRVLADDFRLARSRAIATQRVQGLVFDADNDNYYAYDSVLTTYAQDPLTKKSLSRNYRSDGRFKGVDLVQAAFPQGAKAGFNSIGSPDGGGTVILELNQARKTITVDAGTGRVRISGG